MKIYKGIYNKVTITGNEEKFILFQVYDYVLRHGVDRKKQESVFFDQESLELGSNVLYNSGERVLTLGFNSKEEQLWINQFFRRQGFKTKKLKKKWYYKEDPKKRVWIDPKTYDPPYPRNPMSDGFLNPATYFISLRLYRKDLEKFLESLKILRENYSYRTLYWDEKPRYKQQRDIKIK